MMPCNGLLYVPSDQCFCQPGAKLLGYSAVAAGSIAGPVADEMIQYFCLHTELVLSAESILLAREQGIEMEVGSEIQDKLRAMHELEQHIGRAGLRALRPHLHFTAKDMWEVHLLEHEANVANHHR